MLFYEEWDGKFTLKELAPRHIPSIGDRLAGGASYHKVLSNFTTYPVLLKSGYNTTANGRAGDIICPPMATIRRTHSGSPRDFSRYEIVRLYEIEDPFIYRVNFRG